MINEIEIMTINIEIRILIVINKFSQNGFPYTGPLILKIRKIVFEV